MDVPQSSLLSSSLGPLPASLHQGLLVVAICGLLSLTATLVLFACLTYRFFTWHRRGQFRGGPNQFLILIYNLVGADIQQAAAFASTIVYVVNDRIEVGTSACSANAWFVSVGDLASSIFTFGIAIHTFFAVVKGRTVSDRWFYIWLVGAWGFIYFLAALTVTLYPHVYVRAGAWCWIDQKYDWARLWLHYLWIFICMLGTVVLYVLIFISLYTRLTSDKRNGREFQATKRIAKYMVVYPAVYVVCTLPLAGGRMAAMTGIQIPYWYYCLAGAAITSSGWLNVIFYILTRRVMIFGKEPPPKSSIALHTFGRYHGSEFYGSVTTVEGPLTPRCPPVPSDKITPAWLSRKPRRRQSDEQYFATIREGMITTKTTVEVTSGPALDPPLHALDIDEDSKSIDMAPRLPR